ncbi:P-loop NTPase fold protein [Campylobacter curvus]|uniref:KAP NTPase domain-containing protein n=2 Tax=Campylobacter curvus TaxID=200 RepID=A7H0D2_CAMC5|nr:P-loop NTPase fold protein [Campylobacter curvus]EAT99908.3 hypothetical protein CCV52592_0416 [Campylobacter curvus 525.92]
MQTGNRAQEIKDRFIELFKREHAICMALNGKWGVGKTYFWNKFVEEEFKEQFPKKQVAYVSLFGIDSIEKIEENILMQIFIRNKIIDVASKVLSADLSKDVGNMLGGLTLGINLSVSSLLSAIKRDEFKDIVVCFDDFERKSNKLPMKDIFGFISKIKEQKNCHIVMIFNTDEVKFNGVEKYKDKIIDYEFNYDPTVEDTYKIVKDELKFFKDYPLEYFKLHKLNNIRVMRRVVNALNDFGFLEEELKDFEYTRKRLVKDIMEIATINTISLNINFEELNQYSFSYFAEDLKEEEHKEDFDKIIEYMHIDHLEPQRIREEVISYIGKSIVDKEIIKDIVHFIKLKEDKYKELSEYQYRLQCDFSINIEEYCEKVKKIFEDDGDMVNVVGANSFMFYMDLIKRFNLQKSLEYQNFAVENLKKILEKSDELPTDELYNIIDFDPQLKSYHDQLLNGKDKAKISTKEGILYILENKNENDFKELEKVDDEVLKNFILTDWKFCLGVLRFLDSRFSTYSGFKGLVSKFIRIFKTINSKRHDIQSAEILKRLNQTRNKN